MHLKELLDNLYLIKVPLPESPLKDLNSYYIKGAQRSLLIDTGFRLPACREALTQALSSLGADMESTDIFLTHMHYDHAGLAPELASGGTRIYMSEKDKQAIERYADPKYWENQTNDYLVTGIPKEELHLMTKMNADPRMYAFGDRITVVSGGDIITVGDYRLECIHTPGHTPGHMCLYDREKEMLICGDHVLFDISPNIIFWYGVEDSLGDYMRSLELVGKLKVKHVFCGHREYSDNFYGRVDELLAHHRERLKEVLGILARRGELAAYKVASHMSWSMQFDDWCEVNPFQKMFAIGEAIAHLDHLIAEGLAGVRNQDGINLYYKK